MARIRSIHPNILIDPDFASVPIPGRLLFIYSWPIADDAGNLERSPRGLKMALFPGDDDITEKKISELTDALIAGRFYLPYEANGKQYLHIRNFAKYQKPDHPTAPKFPLYPGQVFIYHLRKGNAWESFTAKNPIQDSSTNVPRTYSESTSNILTGEERKGIGGERKGFRTGKDRKGVEGEKKDHTLVPSPLEGAGAGASQKTGGNSEGTITGEIPESKKALIRKVESKDHQKTLEALFGEVNIGNMTSRDAINQAVNMRCLKRIEAEQLFTIYRE